MDLNYLLTRHQTALMCAERAKCTASRAVHLALASGYEARIDDMQRRTGATHPMRAPRHTPVTTAWRTGLAGARR